MSQRSMAYTVIDRLFLVVYGSEDPTDDEWATYLEDVKRHDVNRTMQLVFTDGGGPSAKQRHLVNALLNGRTVPVAVISGSAAIRGVVTALSWFNSGIRAFPHTGLLDALAYLEIPPSRADLIEREAGKLRLLLDRSADR